MLKFAALSFVVGASALSLPRSTCTFELTASGAQSGTLGQLPDGQIRIGGGLPASSFDISNGGITDTAGRGCILTPSIKQLQCDVGAGPTQGFSISSSGILESSGSSKFYACPATESEWNVYTTPVIGQTKCVEVTLKASGCFAPPPPPPSTTTSACATVTNTVTVTVTECPVQTTTAVLPPAVSTHEVPPPAVTTTKVIQTTLPPPSSVYQPTTTPITTTTTVESHPPPPTTTVPTTTIKVVLPPPSTKPTISLSTGTGYGTAPPSYPTVKPSAPTWQNTTRPAPPPSSTKPAATTTTVVLPPPSCPTSLVGSPDSGNWQYPHLIVPVSSITPNTAAGTSYFGTISPTVSTVFNFDIPASYAGKTCSLVFLLPHHADLETSAYTLSGSGAVEFDKLTAIATQGTTWSNVPSIASSLGSFPLTEGSSTVVSTFACPAGSAVAYEAKAVGSTDLYYFQDYNPSPLGLYITTC